MSDALDRNFYFVMEHVGLYKAANNFDIFDPQNGSLLLECREERLGPLTKLLRFTDWKRLTPFDIEIRTPGGRAVTRVTHGVSLFLSRVEVLDENDERIGGFKQKLFSVGGRFDALDREGRALRTLQGEWTGWDFRFSRDDREFARVKKNWAGVGKELFTSSGCRRARRSGD